MRLPQPLLESTCFAFADVDDFIRAYRPGGDEEQAIRSLDAMGLPPITTPEGLATMLGVNAGFLWSFSNRPQKHYRTFTIPKGHGHRTIHAPRVGLKVLQKWLSHHLSRCYESPAHVFGFVPGKSHIQAAVVHASAQWALSVDVENFFETTPKSMVEESFRSLGYDPQISAFLANICCLSGHLAQGAPTSPPLSNVCFRATDQSLMEIANQFSLTLSRYADDVVFSGAGSAPNGLHEAIEAIFAGTPWQLSPEKVRYEPIKGRIKIHGLLVRNGIARLTKGYRNKIRAYNHILLTKDHPHNFAQLLGHVGYARHVTQVLANEGAIHPSDEAWMGLGGGLSIIQPPSTAQDKGAQAGVQQVPFWQRALRWFRQW